MQKARLCVCFFFALALPSSVAALAFGPVDPVHWGMGGAGVAGAGYFTPFTNPAHLAMVNQRRDVFVDLPLAGYADTAASRFDDPLERFQSTAAAYVADPSATHRAAVESASTRLDGRTDYSNRWLAGVVGLPHLPVSIAAYVRGQDIETLSAEVGQQDLAATPPAFAANVTHRGVLLVESGALVAKVVSSTPGGANRLVVGVSPKLISARTSYFQIPATADPDTAAEAHRTRSHFNLDLGVVKEFAYVWKVGLVARNVFANSVRWAEPTLDRLRLEPEVRGGLAYRGPRLLMAIDLDLTRNAAVGFEGASRLLNVGGEWTASPALRLRGGVYSNLLDGRTGAAAGLGTTISILELDLAVFGDTEERRGVVGRFGVRF